MGTSSERKSGNLFHYLHLYNSTVSEFVLGSPEDSPCPGFCVAKEFIIKNTNFDFFIQHRLLKNHIRFSWTTVALTTYDENTFAESLKTYKQQHYKQRLPSLHDLKYGYLWMYKDSEDTGSRRLIKQCVYVTCSWQERMISKAMDIFWILSRSYSSYWTLQTGKSSDGWKEYFIMKLKSTDDEDIGKYTAYRQI